MNSVIDNFDLISKLLDFSEQNTFYFLQILKRKKENPEMKTGTYVIDQFYLYSLDDLFNMKEKIVERCIKYNARAYINLNRLDLEKIALFTVKQIMEYVILKDFRSVKNAYSSVCGSHHSEKTKKWVIDIDKENVHLKDQILEIVAKLHAEVGNKDYGIVAEIPTRSGIHIISNPFNLEKFRIMTQHFEHSVDCQKNSPTVLYIPQQSSC